MPFLGNAATFGQTRQGAAHSGIEFAGNLLAGATQIVGPLRCMGMQRVVLSFSQSTLGVGSATARIEYRVKNTWRIRQDNIAAIAGTVITSEVLVPSARQVRVVITAPGGGAVSVVVNLGVLQGS